jgi:acyl carrier protein
VAWLADRISEILGVDPGDIDIHDQLTEYGMDSRQFVDLRFDLEELLGRELPSTLMWDNPSIASLVEMLTQPGEPSSAITRPSEGIAR